MSLVDDIKHRIESLKPLPVNELAKKGNVLKELAAKEAALRDNIIQLKEREHDLTLENEAATKCLESKRIEINELKLKKNLLIEEANNLIKETTSLRNHSGSQEVENTVDDLKRKLDCYRKMTGVRFDYNSPDYLLTGVCVQQSDVPSKNKVVPFIIKNNEVPQAEIKTILWDKMKETSTPDADIESISKNLYKTHLSQRNTE